MKEKNKNIQSEYSIDGLYLQSDIIKFLEQDALDGMAFWDANIQPTGWLSPKFWKTLGYEANHLVEPIDIIYEEDILDITDYFDSLRTGINNEQQKTIKFRHKNGDAIWMQCKSIVTDFENGIPTRIFFVMNNITEITMLKEKYESHLRKVLEGTHAAMFILNCSNAGDMKYSLVNQNFLDYFNVSEAAVIGNAPSTIFSNEIGQMLESGYRRCYDSKSKMEFDETFHLANGTLCFQTALTPIIENGEVVQIVGSKKDITDNKRIEAELLVSIENARAANHEAVKNEKTLLEAQRIAHIGSYELCFKKELWDSSEELDRIFGIDNNYIRSIKGWIDLVQEDWQQIMERYFYDSIRSKNTFDMIYKIVNRKSGEERWVHGIGEFTYDEQDQPLKMVGSIQDITDRVNFELASNEKQKMIETIVNLTPDSLYIYDLGKKKTIFSNRALETMLGYSKEEMKCIGDKISETLMQPDDFVLYSERLNEGYVHLRDGELFHYEFRMKAKNGSWRYLSATETVYKRYADGLPEQIFGVIHDINDIKFREEELKAARQRAEMASLAKAQFLANMSHEIRTPLNGLMGMLQLLELTALNEEQYEYLNISKKSSDSLLHIINDILEYSKIEANQVIIKSEPFNLRDMILELDLLFRPSIKNVLFKTVIADDIPKMLLGDAFRIKQVLTNILGNAVKFTSVGEISLKVQNIRHHEAENIILHFEVSDTGLGIPAEHLDTIFDRFTQVDESNTRQFGGTGLGLAICRGLVEQMGGSIWVESHEGRGSKFVFDIVLKRIKGYEEDNPEEAEVLDEKPHKINILIAEDDDVSRMVMKKIVQNNDWDAILVEDGQKAFEAFVNNKFDIIVLDVQMPYMDGYETSALIRAFESKEKLKRTPIIAMTAYALTGDRDKCINAGMNDYLSKPFNIDAFYAIIRKWTAVN